MFSGSKTGKLLPTGKPTNTLAGTPATCIDVGNPCVFVRASDLGVQGGILPPAVDKDKELLARLENIRREASVAMGISQDAASAPASIPKIAMVAAPYEHALTSGVTVDEKSSDIVVRAISVGQPHGAVPITVAMALATAANMEGSVARDCVSSGKVSDDGLTISHPSGTMMVGAKFDANGMVESAQVFSTARRLMEGRVYL